MSSPAEQPATPPLVPVEALLRLFADLLVDEFLDDPVCMVAPAIEKKE